MTDIVERARARAHHHFLNTVTHDLFIELADEIERLRGEVDRLSTQLVLLQSSGERK